MAGGRVCRYRVVWRRSGDSDSFCHEVQAAGPDDARKASLAEVGQALGPNLQFWTLESVMSLQPDGEGLWGRVRQWFAGRQRQAAPEPSQQSKAGR